MNRKPEFERVKPIDKRRGRPVRQIDKIILPIDPRDYVKGDLFLKFVLGTKTALDELLKELRRRNRR